MRSSYLLACAGIMALAATAASAKTFKYTLVGSDGTVYCDGLTVTTTDNVVYSGAHTGCGAGVAADGFAAHIKGYIPVVDVATTDGSGNPTVFTFLFSSKAMAWEALTDESGALTVVNSGTLQKGEPDIVVKAQSSVAGHHAVGKSALHLQ